MRLRVLLSVDETLDGNIAQLAVEIDESFEYVHNFYNLWKSAFSEK